MMVERRIRHWTIVAPDRNPQSPRLNDLNRVIESEHIGRRTSVGQRGLTFMFVGETRYFHIAKLELPNQPLENHEAVWALDRIVVKVSMSRQHYIDPNGGKLTQEPAWVTAC